MRVKKLFLLAAAVCASLASSASATIYFKMADEWGTILNTGARTGTSGNRFLNVEGQSLGNFASTAAVRFYTTDIVTKANTEFGVGGWQVNAVNMVFSQSNSGFTAAGGVNLYLVGNDTIGFTNGTNDTSSPGHSRDCRSARCATIPRCPA